MNEGRYQVTSDSTNENSIIYLTDTRTGKLWILKIGEKMIRYWKPIADGIEGLEEEK